MNKFLITAFLALSIRDLPKTNQSIIELNGCQMIVDRSDLKDKQDDVVDKFIKQCGWAAKESNERL